MEPPVCCICASGNQNCVRCSCVRERRTCVNCRRGNNCQNRGAQPPAEENDDETLRGQVGAEGVTGGGREEGEVGAMEDRQDQALQQEEGAHDNRFWQRWSLEEAGEWVSNAYRQTVTFSSRNLFKPPKCNAIRSFIEEKTLLIRAYINSSPIAPFALKTLAVLPHLICQRTHRKSKHSENVKAVQRRMELWQKGEVDRLLKEAKSLQERTCRMRNRKKRTEDKARQFADKMRQGKVAMAIRSLAMGEEATGVLPLNEETCKILKDKHPDGRPAPPETKFPGEYHPPHPIIFERITGDMIWKHALHTQGAAGPSGMDAKGWKILLSNNTFGTAASDLREAIATLARKMATDDCQHLGAYTSCRLIPLDKNPGCRPIGIGEVLRRIIGKSIMEVVKDDVKRAVGNLQVCAGQHAGCEAAIHSMRKIYEDPDCEAILMVDASNAFNNINRETTLHNIRVKCPAFAKYVENTYKEPAQLFISGNAGDKTMGLQVIQSSEGTTQGDPVAMAVYALGLLKLQQTLQYDHTKVKQVAYADDLTGAGKTEDIKKWWDMVVEQGPKLGYFPNASKSVLIVKPEFYEQAKVAFRDSAVKVTKDGQRHLGAVIGTENFRENYVKDSVKGWVNEIKLLSTIAKTEPQAAYSAFTYGLKHKWNYLMRTVKNISPLLAPLECAIREELIPAISNGRYPNDLERKLLELPPRLGGLGIPNPQNLAEYEFQNSVNITASLTENIVAQNEWREVNNEEIRAIRYEIAKDRENRQKNELQNLMQLLHEDTKRKVEMAQEVGASNWLTALPIREKGFSLNKKEFTDAIALRYGWPLDGLPNQCACGTPFDANHAMVCKKGGFVCMRHDEVRDLTAQMLHEVCRDVTVEPMLLPLEGEHLGHLTANTLNDARVDVSARGFWTRGQRAFFDIRIFDPMAHCHRVLSLEAAHRRNEQEKRRAYEERIQNVDQGSFTPLIFTSSGGMGPSSRSFYGRLAEVLAEKKQQPRSSVVAWMRCRLSFSLLRSALLCLRGTRSLPPKPTDVQNLDFEATVVDSQINERLD